MDEYNRSNLAEKYHAIRFNVQQLISRTRFPSIPNICSLCHLFISHCFPMTSPCQPSSHQFLLNTFLPFPSLSVHLFFYYQLSCQLSTFPLDLRDTRLSPTTPSTFLQALTPAVILIITTSNYLVDFSLDN